MCCCRSKDCEERRRACDEWLCDGEIEVFSDGGLSGGAGASDPRRCRLGVRSFGCSCESRGFWDSERPLASTSGSLDRFRPLAGGASRGVFAGLPARGILVFSVPSSEMIGVVG